MPGAPYLTRSLRQMWIPQISHALAFLSVIPEGNLLLLQSSKQLFLPHECKGIHKKLTLLTVRTPYYVKNLPRYILDLTR